MTVMYSKRDTNNNPIWATPFCETIFDGLFQSNTPQTVSIPNNMNTEYVVVFTKNTGSIKVACNGLAEFPNGDIDTGHGELNPAAKFCKGGDTLSIVTDTDDVTVQVLLYTTKATNG